MWYRERDSGAVGCRLPASTTAGGRALVCPLCGAKNASQQPSCIVCSSPLEREPERRGLTRPVARGTAQYTWLALSVAVGALLGIWADNARLPTSFNLGGTIAWGIFGGLAGGALGTLPGSGGRLLARNWARLRYRLYLRWAHRGRERVRTRCETILHDDPEDREAELRLAAAMWLEGDREQAEQVLLRVMKQPDPPVLARHNYAVVNGHRGAHAAGDGGVRPRRSRLAAKRHFPLERRVAALGGGEVRQGGRLLATGDAGGAGSCGGEERAGFGAGADG